MDLAGSIALKDGGWGSMPGYIRAFRRFWQISPFRIALVAFIAGVVPYFIALQFSSIGSIAYWMPVDGATICDQAAIAAKRCIAKEVGYAHALNWWPPLVLLFPFALFFAFDSVQNTQMVTRQMLADRMFAKTDWSGPVSDLTAITRKLWRTFFWIAVPLFLLICVVTAKDWWCVVHWPLMLETPLGDVVDTAREKLVPKGFFELLQASGCHDPGGQENDWSVSATFGRIDGLAPLAPRSVAPGWMLNYIFSAYNYVLLILWAGLLLAYFGFVLALAIIVYDINQGRHGFRLVLNLNSADTRNRQGFETLEAIFKPCVYVTILCFVMAFLMRIQNVYLRDTEFGTVYRFLFGDITAAMTKILDIDPSRLLGWFGDLLVALKKFFDFDQFSDPQSLLGAPAILVMLGLVTAALAHILRKAATDAQRRVISGLGSAQSAERVAAYYDLSVDEARERANTVETWPLSWPELNYAIRIMGLGLFCYVFYRVAFVWIGVVAFRSIQGRLSEKSRPTP